MSRWLWGGMLVGLVASCQAGSTPREQPTTLRQAQYGNPQVVIWENFNAPATTMTPVSGGTWQVANQRYQLRSPASALPNGNLSVASAVIAGDFQIDVQGMALAGAGWNDWSVVFSYRSPSDYYFASFNEGNDGETNGFFRYRDGVLTELADFPKLSTPGVMQEVRIIRNDHTVIYVDEAGAVVTATDPGIGDGQIGVGSRNDAADFDDLVVSVPETRPTPFPVAITSPAPGSLLSGFAVIGATSDQAVAVQFIDVRGTPGVEDASAPFSYELDTLAFPYRPQLSVTAQARSASGELSYSKDVEYFLSNDCKHIFTGQSTTTAIGPFSSNFSVTWYQSADDAQIDAGFALSQGPAQFFSQASAILLFAPDQQIQARNGDVYASVDPVLWRSGEGYLFRMDVDLAHKTYSVVGRRANDAAFTIARDYAFRTNRQVATLDHWSGINDPGSGGAEAFFCNVAASQP